jgi:hypothetical protein
VSAALTAFAALPVVVHAQPDKATTEALESWAE